MTKTQDNLGDCLKHIRLTPFRVQGQTVDWFLGAGLIDRISTGRTDLLGPIYWSLRPTLVMSI